MSLPQPEISEAFDFLYAMAEGGRRPRLKITGTSMTPFLRDGMIVEVGPLPARVAIGEILVYRAGPRRIVAHRLIARREKDFITAGDAQPTSREYINEAEIIGYVRRIWKNEQIRRPLPRWYVSLAARAALLCRPLRALSQRLSALFFAVAKAPLLSTNPAAALTAAVRATIAHDRAAFIDALASITPDDFVTIVKKHHCSGLISEAVTTLDVHAEIDAGIFERLQQARIATAFQIARVREEVGRAGTLLRKAGIAAVFLKGAARIAGGVNEGQFSYSGDVDILVDAKDIIRTITFMALNGYAATATPQLVAYLHKRHHHHAPVQRSAQTVPLEFHTELTVPGSTSTRLTMETLAPFFRTIDAESGPVTVLNALGTAVHLAYHARTLQPLRDLVLLGEMYAALSDLERERFWKVVGAEKRDAIRLRAAAHWALAVRNLPIPPHRSDAAVARYLRWVAVSERLHPALQARCAWFESWYGRAPLTTPHVPAFHARLRRRLGWLLATPRIFWLSRTAVTETSGAKWL